MGIFGRKKDITNMVFDWDLYWKDIENGVDNKTIVKKMENLDYYVSKAEQSYGKISVAAYAK
jgi:hypothetical protein|nr:MAG TPA: hypothetical protein [Caudoviricetes sp.]